MKNECELVKDLMPNYIEKLTSNDTNQFIEEHLKGCDNCKKVLANMSSDISTSKNISKKEIDYIRKYKRNIRNLKVFIIAVIIIICTFFIGKIGYKFYVLNKTISRNYDYIISGSNNINSNYMLTIYDGSVESDKTPIKIYNADGVLKKVKGDKTLEYSKGDEYYFIDPENKTYKISNDKNLIENKDNLNIKPQKLLSFENKPSKIEILKLAFDKNIVIYEQDFRGKMYYVIRNMNGSCLWIDIDTGFIEREVNNGKSREYRVFSGVVTYREIEKPDLTGYILEKIGG